MSHEVALKSLAGGVAAGSRAAEKSPAKLWSERMGVRALFCLKAIRSFGVPKIETRVAYFRKMRHNHVQARNKSVVKRLDRKIAEFYTKRAEKEITEGKPGLAAHYFYRAKPFTHHGDVTRKTLEARAGISYFIHAVKLHMEGKPDEAAKPLEKACKLVPTHAEDFELLILNISEALANPDNPARPNAGFNVHYATEWKILADLGIKHNHHNGGNSNGSPQSLI